MEGSRAEGGAVMSDLPGRRWVGEGDEGMRGSVSVSWGLEGEVDVVVVGWGLEGEGEDMVWDMFSRRGRRWVLAWCTDWFGWLIRWTGVFWFLGG